MEVCHGEILFIVNSKELQATCSFCEYFLTDMEHQAIPLVYYRLNQIWSIVPKIGKREEVFIIEGEVFQISSPSSLQSLVQHKFSSALIHLVNHRTCILIFDIATKVSKRKKQNTVYDEMLHGLCSFGW